MKTTPKSGTSVETQTRQKTMKIESFVAEQVRDITAEAINDALENGDAIAIAKFLREQIRAGWIAGMESAGVPEELQAKLKFSI